MMNTQPTRRHRSVRFEVRLTHEEAEELQKQARVRRISRTEFLRLAAIGQVQYERHMVQTMVAAVNETIVSTVETIAQRLVDAMVEGLAFGIEAITHEALPDDTVDTLADRMRDAYRPDESKEE